MFELFEKRYTPEKIKILIKNACGDFKTLMELATKITKSNSRDLVVMITVTNEFKALTIVDARDAYLDNLVSVGTTVKGFTVDNFQVVDYGNCTLGYTSNNMQVMLNLIDTVAYAYSSNVENPSKCLLSHIFNILSAVGISKFDILKVILNSNIDFAFSNGNLVIAIASVASEEVDLYELYLKGELDKVIFLEYISDDLKSSITIMLMVNKFHWFISISYDGADNGILRDGNKFIEKNGDGTTYDINLCKIRKPDLLSNEMYEMASKVITAYKNSLLSGVNDIDKRKDAV